MTPAQRELNDQKYESMKALYDAMPQEARDTQFAVYEARTSVDAKADSRPLKKFKLSYWKENQLTDSNTLSLFLEDKFGPGRYLIEPQDEHGQRILKFPFWCVSTEQFDEDAMDDDYDLDDRPRRRRRRRLRDDYDDDDFDDPSDRRESIADGLLMAQKVSSAGVGQAMSNQKDMVSLMLLTNQETSRTAREDAMRREDQRARDDAEVRRREQERRDAEEKRRYDEERKREDDKIRRDEEIRRENDKREEARREADRKHEREMLAAKEASDRKFQMVLAALPAILPLAERFLKPTPAPARETDPITMMIAKTFLDTKHNQDPNAAVQVVVEATKLGSQLQAEQMRSAMQMQGEMSKLLFTKTMEEMKSGGGSGKNMIETITELVSGAASLAEKLIPAKPAANPYQQQAQQRIQHQRPAAQSAPTSQQQPAPQAQQPVQQQPVDPDTGLTAEQMELAEAALNKAVQANPTYGTLRALYAIQTKRFASQAEYQKLIEYSVTCMPLDLRVAILDNNEGRVMELVLPTIQTNAELFEWAMKTEVQDWLRAFVPQLGPTIEAIFKLTAEQQREQYVAVLAQQQQELAPQESVTQGAPITAQDTVVPVQEGAPVGEQALDAGTPAQQAPVTAEVIQGPGSIPDQALQQADTGAPPVSGSHLDADV